MIQLVRLHVWRAAGDDADIALHDAEHGVHQARRKDGQLVHDSALADLSAVDRSFLAAMAFNDGASKIADVAQRLGLTGTYARQYRLRLLAAEVIETRGHGLIIFTLPGLREYRRQRAASADQWDV